MYEPLVLKPGLGISTKRKPQPKTPLAEPVEPASPLEVPKGAKPKAQKALEPEPVMTEQNTEEESGWSEVTRRGRRDPRRPPKPPTPKNPKPKHPLANDGLLGRVQGRIHLVMMKSRNS